MSSPPSAPMNAQVPPYPGDDAVMGIAAPAAAAVEVALVEPIPLHPEGAAAAHGGSAAAHEDGGSSTIDDICARDARDARAATRIQAVVRHRFCWRPFYRKVRLREHQKKIRQRNLDMLAKLDLLEEIDGEDGEEPKTQIRKTKKGKIAKIVGRKSGSGNGKPCPAKPPCSDVRSGPCAKKCSGCGAVFPEVCGAAAAQRKRRQENKEKRKVPYEKAAKKARLEYLEKNFMMNCPLCCSVAGFADPKGFVLMCKHCRLAICCGCLKDFEDKQLKRAFEFDPTKAPEAYEHAFGKWHCPGNCQGYYKFPVVSNKDYKPSMDVEEWIRNNDWCAKKQWKMPENPSNWDRAFASNSWKRMHKEKTDKLWQALVNQGYIDIGQYVHGLSHINTHYTQLAWANHYDPEGEDGTRSIYSLLQEYAIGRTQNGWAFDWPSDDASLSSSSSSSSSSAAASSSIVEDTKWLTVDLSLLAEGVWKGKLGINIDTISRGSARVTKVHDDSPASNATPEPITDDMCIQAIRVIKPAAAAIEYEVPETKEEFSQIVRGALVNDASELKFKVRCVIII